MKHKKNGSGDARTLAARVAEAERNVELARKKTNAAKLEFKKARKAFKQAKKAAKLMRKSKKAAKRLGATARARRSRK